MSKNMFRILLFGSLSVIVVAIGVLVINYVNDSKLSSTTTTVNPETVYQAILSGNRSLYGQYIDNGADFSFAIPDGKDKGKTPLELIINDFDYNNALKLIENGFDLKKVNNNHISTITNLLVFNEVYDNENVNEIILTLIDQVKDEIENPDSTGYSLLQNSIYVKNDGITSFLLDNITDINKVYNDKTALSYACFLGYVDLDVIQLLVEKGANVNFKGEDGYTCLMYSVIAMDDDTVEYLLTLPNLEVNANNNEGRTALHLTMEYSNENALELLLSDSRVYPELKDNNGDTALTYACGLLSDPFSSLQIFVSHDVDYLAIGKDNENCLMKAITNNHTQTVEYLLSLGGFNINQQNTFGQTALHMAVLAENVDLIDELLEISGINLSLKDENNRTAKELAQYLTALNPENQNYAQIYAKLAQND